MLFYNSNLKSASRQLRKRMTDSERLLWARLKGKQLLGVQFYRQKPVGPYVVDFYAAKAKLVIELDGSQHFETIAADKDRVRDSFLRNLGLMVLRFDDRQVLLETDAVMEVIFRTLGDRLSNEIPPDPPFSKGGA